MSASTLPFEAPRPVAQKVSRLRTLVRLYVLAEGLAATAAAAFAAFWAALLIDWSFEPVPAVRMVLWAVAVAVLAVVGWRSLGRRLFASLRSDSLALLVERRYPHLGEGLITTVQAAAATGELPIHRQLIDATARRAADGMDQVALANIFDFRPLVRKSLLAAALGVAIALFAALAPGAFAVWVSRMRLSPELWPRQVALTVVGFDRANNRTINVARNDEYQLEVLASLVDGHQAPAVVEIRWRRPSDGVRGAGPMVRIGEARPGRDAAQRYSYAFKVASDLEFDVIGGDDRVRNLRLHAVERPAVTHVALDVTYPEYMNRAPRTVAVSGRAELPEGASAVCRIVANKPLESARIHDPSAQTDLVATMTPDRPQEFTFPINAAASDRVFLIMLHDADSVENREPIRLPLAVLPDSPPELAVQLRGIGTAVTPQARIPLAGKVSDDYGLTDAWFEYQVDQEPPAPRPLAAPVAGAIDHRLNEAFDLAEVDPQTNRPRVDLKPGQQFTLTVKARDAYDLVPEGPADDARAPTAETTPAAARTGASARFRLDVVTASELRALLEKRELGLRERFEAIFEKMQGVDELINRIDLAQAAKPADDDAQAAADPATETLERVGPRERELGRIAGSRQSATQLAFETGGVAAGFDDILAELENNRVDTAELHERLEQGISAPLKEIGGKLLPALEERLGALQAVLEAADDRAGASLAACQAESGEIIVAMRRVLDRMLELESYNELVELLRGIVSDHQNLKERTQDEQKQKLRSLLED